MRIPPPSEARRDVPPPKEKGEHPPFRFTKIGDKSTDAAFELVRVENHHNGVWINYSVWTSLYNAAIELSALIELSLKFVKEKGVENMPPPSGEKSLIHMSDAEVLAYIEKLRKDRLDASVKAAIQRAEKAAPSDPL